MNIEPRTIFYIFISLSLIVSCECKNKPFKPEECLDYTVVVHPKEDTIYISEGGKVDLTLTIDGNNDDAKNAAYTLKKLEENSNKKGTFSLSSNETLHYGSNTLTYTAEETGKHCFCLTVEARKDDGKDTILKVGQCTINVEEQRLITYQTTAKVMERDCSKIEITISVDSKNNQSKINPNTDFCIEEVEWTTGIEGTVDIIPLKEGKNYLNFKIKDYSELRSNHIPELVLTLGGPGKARSKVTVDLNGIIEFHRFRARVLNEEEKNIDKVLSMPMDSDEDKESKKEELALILPRAEKLLSILEKDLAVPDSNVDTVDQAQLDTHATLNGLKREQCDKRQRRDRLIEKIEKIKSQFKACMIRAYRSH